MNTATTRLTCATSRSAMVWKAPGITRPRPTPTSMPRPTQMVRKRSNKPMGLAPTLLDVAADGPSSAAGVRRLDGNAHRLAAGRGCAAGRGVHLGLGAFTEHGNVAERVEVLPGDTLRVGDPVLVAARI